jgi:hypothetical protein
MAKYNQLLRVEELLGFSAVYPKGKIKFGKWTRPLKWVVRIQKNPVSGIRLQTSYLISYETTNPTPALASQ